MPSNYIKIDNTLMKKVSKTQDVVYSASTYRITDKQADILRSNLRTYDINCCQVMTIVSPVVTLVK